MTQRMILQLSFAFDCLNFQKEPEEKRKPDLGLSGKLAEDTNVFNGVVVKYNEPPEAKKPKRRWRLYVFKGEESLPFIPLHRCVICINGRLCTAHVATMIFLNISIYPR